ncbi:hypothetical protein F4778DRAFT_785445 [Xylariomycetidae sp. FL2044]|nr:hypothetical protein F4778DRAFT_785445 [Xylariomycetidae sp. FL2044]
MAKDYEGLEVAIHDAPEVDRRNEPGLIPVESLRTAIFGSVRLAARVRHSDKPLPPRPRSKQRRICGFRYVHLSVLLLILLATGISGGIGGATHDASRHSGQQASTFSSTTKPQETTTKPQETTAKPQETLRHLPSTPIYTASLSVTSASDSAFTSSQSTRHSLENSPSSSTGISSMQSTPLASVGKDETTISSTEEEMSRTTRTSSDLGTTTTPTDSPSASSNSNHDCPSIDGQSGTLTLNGTEYLFAYRCYREPSSDEPTGRNFNASDLIDCAEQCAISEADGTNCLYASWTSNAETISSRGGNCFLSDSMQQLTGGTGNFGTALLVAESS